MSARLLKNEKGVATQPFTTFDFPEHDGRFADQISHRAGVTHTDPETQAAKIIEAAYIQAAEIEREMREQMRATVRAEVEAEISRVVNPWRDQLVQSLDTLTSLRGDIAQRAEDEVVRLALEIAHRVIHLEVHTGNQVAVELARVGLSRIPSRTPATVHLNPEDLDYVQANQDQLEANHALSFVADRSIGRGGCVIQTEMGEVDASIEHQFAEIEAAILNN